ncbi:MAG: Validamycin A dioxygenase [Chlamydiae bacterium]|nr:Validamycin A dioxygenase [Chlamydiota bacterium]
MNLSILPTNIPPINNSFDQELDSSIPILDMHDLQKSERRHNFFKTLEKALKEVGFFALTNVPICQEKVQKAHDQMKTYFDQSLDVKLKTYEPSNAGERGYGFVEQAKSGARDPKEFFHSGRELPIEDLQKLDYPENLWPDDLAVKEVLTMLYEMFDELTFNIAELIAESLNESPVLFRSWVENGDHLLRSVRYYEDAPQEQLWAHEHTDITLFTLLPRASQPGLQVLSKEGKWIDVLVPENALIVNGGDMLENLTNGYYKSVKHRVVNKKLGEDRYAFIYFVHAHTYDSMSPLPSCIEKTGGEQKYLSATRKELLWLKLIELGRGTQAMADWLNSQGHSVRLD